MEQKPSSDTLRELILKTHTDPKKIGKAFRITFEKKDGTVREMRARLGLKRNLTGKGQSFNPADYNLLTVWELGNGYRNINLNTVLSLELPDGSKHLREVIR